MTRTYGRKDPAASLYSHLVKPSSDVFYDFACNLQEYCLNREKCNIVMTSFMVMPTSVMLLSVHQGFRALNLLILKLYFFYEWNKRERQVYLKKLQVTLAGLKELHNDHDSREDQPNQCRLTALVHLSLWTSYKES
ncbi:hypothetical protein MAR_026607 [Mya arenaria]|uniref:Uncharacterized protein n=1 Tax=Mya arenaria TaxID=6604 RepID=A0ABY7ER03_MYAAR|nr:hypothetical protein MAR_026607 [Mya arenaria]